MIYNEARYVIKKSKYRHFFKRHKRKIHNLYERFIQLTTLIIIALSFIVLLFGISDIINNYASKSVILINISNIFYQIGKQIFNNLAFLFCLITIGVITNRIEAIFTGFIGFLSFIATQQFFIHYDVTNQGQKYIKDIFYFFKEDVSFILTSNWGFKSLNISFLGGVIIGIICGWVYNKLNNIRLIKGCGLLNGLPLLILITIFICSVLSILFLLIWIGIGYLLIFLYNWIKWSDFNGSSGQSFIYSLVNILLTPLGFKEDFNNLFSQINNETLTSNEFKDFFYNVNLLHGWKYSSFLNMWNNEEIQTIWLYLDTPEIINKKYLVMEWINILPTDSLPVNQFTKLPIYDWFVDKYLVRLMPLKIPPNYSMTLGACVGAGLAMFLNCKKENKLNASLIIFVISLTVFISGNTVILDVLFFFISPFLFFLVYVPIAGLNGLFMNLLQVHIWSLTTHGLISLIFNGIMYSAKGTNYQWIFLLSAFWCVMVTLFFSMYIKHKDLPFIGRRERILPRTTWRQYHNLWNH